MPLPLGTESTVIQDRQVVFAAPQPTGGTPVAPVGADPTLTTGGPLRVLESDFGLSQVREKHGHSRAGRREFAGSTYTSMRETTWTIRTRVIPPRNLLGTIMPEIHHLLVAALGGVTVNAGTSIVYALADRPRSPLLSLARLVNEGDNIMGEWLADAVVDSCKVTFAGGQPPEVEFSGKAAQHIAAAITALNGAASASTTITIAHAHAIDVGARIQVGSETNSGAGYVVTAVDSVGTGLTLNAAVSASDGAIVRPFFPTATYSDQEPLGAIEGGVTIGGSNVPLKTIEWTCGNQVEFVEDEAGSEAFTDGVPGEQETTGTLSLRATERELRRIVARKRFQRAAIALALGGGGTNRNHTLSWPQVEFDSDKLTVSRVGETSAPFRALDSVDGAADAFTWTWA